MKYFQALCGLVMLGLTGCGFGSLSPIVPEDAAQFDARLLGAWMDTSSHESVVITGGAATGYSIVCIDEDGTVGRFEGRLGTLGDSRVLDVWPARMKIEASGSYESLLCRLHAPVLIDSIGPVLRVRLLEPDSLKQFLKREPSATPHVFSEDIVVLTAPTPELRRFLVAFLRRPGVVGEPATYTRFSR